MFTTRARTRTARALAAKLLLWTIAAVAAIILLGVLFTVLNANPHNWLVRNVHGWGYWLTTPFHDLFMRADPKQNVLINWLLAALVYVGLGALLARLLRGPA